MARKSRKRQSWKSSKNIVKTSLVVSKKVLQPIKQPDQIALPKVGNVLLFENKAIEEGRDAEHQSQIISSFQISRRY